MDTTRETPGEGQIIDYAELVAGDIINIGSRYITVQYADSSGIWDVYANHYPLASLPRDIYYMRNLFDA